MICDYNYLRKEICFKYLRKMYLNDVDFLTCVQFHNDKYGKSSSLPLSLKKHKSSLKRNAFTDTSVFL